MTDSPVDQPEAVQPRMTSGMRELGDLICDSEGEPGSLSLFLEAKKVCGKVGVVVKEETVADVQQPCSSQNPPPALSNGANYEDYVPESVSKNSWFGDCDETLKMFSDSLAKMPTQLKEVDLLLDKGDLTSAQKFALSWMKWRESSFPGGGVVAENGTSKVAEVSVLIKTNPEGNLPAIRAVGRHVPSKATLVVCPLTRIFHLETEFRKEGLEVYRYRSSNGIQRSIGILTNWEVVLTTHQTVAKEILQRGRSPLKSIYWTRIVLVNPTHMCSSVTHMADAICQLEACHRWALTETDIIPTIKSQVELFSSICTFLRVVPFDNRDAFESLIGLTKICSAGKKRFDVLANALIFSQGVSQNPGRAGDARMEFSMEEEDDFEGGHTTTHPDFDPLSAARQSWYMDAELTLQMFKDSLPDMAVGGDDKESKNAPLEIGQLTAIQKLTVTWMQKRESSFPGGGILIDNGVCKAAEVGALIKSQLQLNIPTVAETKGLFSSKATLIVLPPQLFFNWENKLKWDGCHLRVFSYTGSQEVIISLKDLAGFDVVVMTYSTVAMEMPEDRPFITDYHPTQLGLSQLINIYWMRIVLVNPVQICNPKTKISEAVIQLSARHRWAIAESPFYTKRGLFSSICTFLRVTPFDNRAVFDTSFFGLKKFSQIGANRLDVLSEALIFNPKGPPKPGGKEIVPIQLSPEERNLYEKALAFAQTKLQKELKRPSAARSYSPGEPSDIFALFLGLRQLCVLPSFHTQFPTPEASVNFGPAMGSRETHVFSRNFLSSKMIQLLKDLEDLRTRATETARPLQKIVIATFCSETLDVILKHLVERKFSVVCLTELTEWKTFLKNQKEFNKKRDKPQICLINSHCYREQLSLPAAKHLFFMEPHWNPEWDLQLERIVGEPKTLRIKRYIAEGTLETRILELRERNSGNSNLGNGITVDEMKRLFEI